MYKSADDKSKRFVEEQRSALERGGEDGRKGESTYGSEGVKVNQSADWSLTFVMTCCISEVDKTWSAEGLNPFLATVEVCNFWYDSILEILAVKISIVFDIAANWSRKDWTVPERDSSIALIAISKIFCKKQ